MVTGSITNSQSLNLYSYVQGNPVSYTDPFGLSPLSGLFTDGNFWHGVLGVLRCVPDPVGIVANLVDAGMYFLEGDLGNGLLSGKGMAKDTKQLSKMMDEDVYVIPNEEALDLTGRKNSGKVGD